MPVFTSVKYFEVCSRGLIVLYIPRLCWKNTGETGNSGSLCGGYGEGGGQESGPGGD